MNYRVRYEMPISEIGRYAYIDCFDFRISQLGIEVFVDEAHFIENDAQSFIPMKLLIDILPIKNG